MMMKGALKMIFERELETELVYKAYKVASKGTLKLTFENGYKTEL